MRVELLVHLEAAEGETPFVWWAESPRIAGLSVAAPHLREVLEQGEAALRDLLAAEGVDTASLVVEPVLCSVDEGASRGVQMEANADELPEREPVRQVTLVAPTGP